jgi:hypothetical protein
MNNNIKPIRDDIKITYNDNQPLSVVTVQFEGPKVEDITPSVLISIDKAEFTSNLTEDTRSRIQNAQELLLPMIDIHPRYYAALRDA